MPKPRTMVEEILQNEGSYVDDFDDPGGTTSYGIALKTLHRLGLDRDRDGDSDADDLRALTSADAIRILTRDYFEKPRLGLLPECLQVSVFDMYVHAGANAVRILQRLLVQMGYELAVDGAVGQQTVAAARAAAKVSQTGLVDAYGIARRNYYFALADARPLSREYVRTKMGGKGGWIRRAEEFISERHHLNQESFQQRIAQWP